MPNEDGWAYAMLHNAVCTFGVIQFHCLWFECENTLCAVITHMTQGERALMRVPKTLLGEHEMLEPAEQARFLAGLVSLRRKPFHDTKDALDIVLELNCSCSGDTCPDRVFEAQHMLSRNQMGSSDVLASTSYVTVSSLCNETAVIGAYSRIGSSSHLHVSAVGVSSMRAGLVKAENESIVRALHERESDKAGTIERSTADKALCAFTRERLAELWGMV
jgi:hypothetical protein